MQSEATWNGALGDNLAVEQPGDPYGVRSMEYGAPDNSTIKVGA